MTTNDVDVDLDVRGLSCPEPVMLVSQELAGTPGRRLVVLANEPHTVRSITAHCEGKGRTVTVETLSQEFLLTIDEA